MGRASEQSLAVASDDYNGCTALAALPCKQMTQSGLPLGSKSKKKASLQLAWEKLRNDFFTLLN